MKIVIIVEGGVVQTVLANGADIEVKVLDLDDMAETLSPQDAAEMQREARAECDHQIY
jgi:hypothetical protein